MNYLLLSIISSSSLVLIFKFSERYTINFFQQIVFNYITAAIIGWLIADHSILLKPDLITQPWVPLSIITGVLFIVIFNTVAIGVRNSGVAAVAVAQKMSLVIPVLLSVWLFNDQLSFLKTAGILLALLAILFSAGKKDKLLLEEKNTKNWLFPVIIFIGSGLIDSSIKYSQVNYLEAIGTNLYITLLYSIAAIAGLLSLGYLLLIGKQQLALKNIVAGILLGIPNYISMYAMVKALDMPGYESSMVFPINNMGIIIFSSIIAWLAFKEKISSLKIVGIAIAIVAIAFISMS